MHLCLVVLLWLSFSWAGVAKAENVKAEKVEIPVRVLTLAELDHAVSLDGLWQFTGPENKTGQIQVPDSWEKFYGRYLPLFGKGVYRLRVQLPPEAIGQILQLNSHLIAGDRYTLTINGQLAGKNGFKPDSLSRVPHFYPFQVKTRELLIEVRIDNQVLHYSGLVSPIRLGKIDAINTLRLSEKMSLNLLLGIFLFLGLFHLVIYAGFRQDKAFLWFGMVCLTAALFCEFYHAHNFEYLVMELPIEWSMKITRLALYSMIPAFLWYANSLSPNYVSSRFTQFVTWISLGFIATLLLPGRLYSPLTNVWFLIMFVFITYNLYQLIRLAGLPEVRPFLLSGVVYGTVVSNDILNAASILHTGYIGRYGFVFFCLTQAGFLAWRLQRSYLTSQALQTELVGVNHNLDELVSERTEEVRAQHDELQKLAQYKSEMTQMLVHDLKAPLNALINLPQQSNLASEEGKKRIYDVSVGMLDIIDGMLDVNQAVQAELKPKPVKQNLRALSDKVMGQLEPWAQSKQIILSNELNDLSLELDTALFERVLQNLLDNAIKQSPIGGQIQLGSQVQSNSVMIWIEDSGPGIAPELLDQIFIKHVSFSQAEAARSSGLGLYFCRQVVEAHHGQITFENSAAGARVVIRLPWAATDTDIAPAMAWSTQQIQHLRPLAASLSRYEVYAVTQIQALLNTLNSETDPEIQAWRQALERAIYEVDEKAYAELIAQITTYSAC